MCEVTWHDTPPANIHHTVQLPSAHIRRHECGALMVMRGMRADAAWAVFNTSTRKWSCALAPSSDGFLVPLDEDPFPSAASCPRDGARVAKPDVVATTLDDYYAGRATLAAREGYWWSIAAAACGVDSRRVGVAAERDRVRARPFCHRAPPRRVRRWDALLMAPVRTDPETGDVMIETPAERCAYRVAVAVAQWERRVLHMRETTGADRLESIARLIRAADPKALRVASDGQHNIPVADIEELPPCLRRVEACDAPSYGARHMYVMAMHGGGMLDRALRVMRAKAYVGGDADRMKKIEELVDNIRQGRINSNITCHTVINSLPELCDYSDDCSKCGGARPRSKRVIDHCRLRK